MQLLHKGDWVYCSNVNPECQLDSADTHQGIYNKKNGKLFVCVDVASFDNYFKKTGPITCSDYKYCRPMDCATDFFIS